MYHHANSDMCSNSLDMLEKHLSYISSNFTSVFPGESLAKRSVCLTFDDAYSDFYFLIFPLLKKYNLKALLAVPSAYLLESCDMPPKKRMDFKHNDLFENWKKGTFCTIVELKEMIASGLVQIASHGDTHTNLLDLEVDLEKEILKSKQILEEKLKIKVESFVFPFGKYNLDLVKKVKEHYLYAFRIGNAIHKDFSGIKGVNYRVDGDSLKSPNEIFRWQNILKYRFKAFLKGFERG
ncbi:MAG: polysaccharide deacetylase family protein [Campylobacteraceae bacterium]|nr:polysaccharide deacetylase family protein [Campylobacteraceae bacterium]